MKKIYYILIFLVPFLSFSQWNQLGDEINHDGLSIKDMSLNTSGDIMVVKFIKFAEDNSTRTSYIKSFKLINNTWTPLGNDFNKIIAYNDENIFDKSIDYVSINDKGDLVNVITAIKKEDDLYDKEEISQMYKYNGSLWEKFGKPFILENSYEGEHFQFVSNTNLLAYVTRDHDVDEDTIYIYEFDNGNWIQKGKKLIIKIRQELGVNLSLDGNSIFTTSWSYYDEERTYITYTYNNEEWNAYGQPIVINQNLKAYGKSTRLKINYNGTRCLLASNDTNDTIYLLAYNYNKQANKWEQLGNDIYTEQKDKFEFYPTTLSNQGNLIAYGYRQDNINKVKLLEFKDNQWKNIPFDYYNETENSVFNFAFSNDDNRLAVNFDTKTKVFRQSKLDVKKQTFGEKFNITPNPSFGETTITLGATYKTANVIVNDVSGKQIDTFTYSNIDKLKLNTNYTAGLYFVTITSQDKIATLKLVVK